MAGSDGGKNNAVINEIAMDERRYTYATGNAMLARDLSISLANGIDTRESSRPELHAEFPRPKYVCSRHGLNL